MVMAAWPSQVVSRPFCIYNGGCFEIVNLLLVSSCEMFTFCVVLHEAKKKLKCAVRTGNHL